MVADQFEASWQSLRPFICECRQTSALGPKSLACTWAVAADGLEIFRTQETHRLPGQPPDVSYTQQLIDPATNRLWELEARSVDGVQQQYQASKRPMSPRRPWNIAAVTAIRVIEADFSAVDLRQLGESAAAVDMVPAQEIDLQGCVGFNLTMRNPSPFVSNYVVYFDLEHGSLVRRLDAVQKRRKIPHEGEVPSSVHRIEIDRFGKVDGDRWFPAAATRSSRSGAAKEFQSWASFEFSFRLGENPPVSWLKRFFPEYTAVAVSIEGEPRGKHELARVEAIGSNGEVTLMMEVSGEFADRTSGDDSLERRMEAEDRILDIRQMLPEPVFDVGLIPVPQSSPPNPLPVQPAGDAASDIADLLEPAERVRTSGAGVAFRIWIIIPLALVLLLAGMVWRFKKRAFSAGTKMR